MMTAFTFGGWLKRRRGGLGLTQKALAQQVGYAEVTLRKVEADELRPSQTMVEKLAEALKIAPEERAQFQRFARDDRGWDEVALPTQGPPVSPPTNLPAQVTPFIGRKHERAALATLLANPNCRLITVLGPGGIGKTRLALQTATEHIDAYSDGVKFVSLVALTSAEFLVPAVATVLNVSFAEKDDLQIQLLGSLRGKKLLLILDNFEHLLDGVTLVAKSYSPSHTVSSFL